MKLPRFQADVRAPVASYTPLSTPQMDPRAGGIAGQAFAEAGEAGIRASQEIQKVAASLQAQKDELDLADLAGRYDLGLASIRENLQRDPNYLGHEFAFTKAANDLGMELEKQTASPAVRQALRLHAAKRFPDQAIQVRGNALRLFHDEQVSRIDQQRDRLSTVAAEATTPEARTEAVTLYGDLVTRAEKRGLFLPTEAEKRRATFTQSVTEKQMDALRRTDRAQLYKLDAQGAFEAADPNTRLKILEAARKDQEREEVNQHKTFTQAREAVENFWSAQANQGRLSDTDLEMALTGRHPFITADKAREYQRINSSPPLGGSDLPIRALMQEYHGGPSSPVRIANFRTRLNALARDMGRPSVTLDKALAELQTDERTMLGIEAQQINAGIKVAEDAYKTKADVVMPGAIGRLQRNQQEADKAEIRNRVRRGESPEKVVDDVLKRRDADTQKIPTRNRGVIDLAE